MGLITKIKRVFKESLATRLGAAGIFLLVAQTVQLLEMHFTPSTPHFHLKDAPFIALSYVTVIFLYQIINITWSWNRFLRVFFVCLYLVSYGLFSSYLFAAKSSFDFSVLIENFSSTFHKEVLDSVVSEIKPDSIVIAAIACLIFIGFEFKSRILTRLRFTYPLFAWCTLVVSYFFVICLPIPFYDEQASFLNSIIRYYSDAPSSEQYKNLAPYPFVRSTFTYSTASAPASRPTVFLIMIESFNKKYVEAKDPEGVVYTPQFNRLLKEGVYVENFYGNSVITVKGQFATLFSTLPSMKGNIYKGFRNLSLQSLPEILRQNGYRTLFFQAHDNPDFDSIGTMMSQNGYDDFVTADHYATPEENATRWGWGLEDGIIYRSLFRYLKTIPTDNKPLFVTVSTICNHLYFDVPPERRKLYPEPKSFGEKYANSLYLSDEQLPIFFEELAKHPEFKDSLIVIVGDHSFPTGDHGIHNNEVGFYEESFKTPLLLIWPNHLKPERIRGPYSQLDIAPTIVDLLHIPAGKNHFNGESIFLTKKGHSVPLIQPFSGTYIGGIQYPFHYMKHLKTGEEFLFNLETDPGELKNLAAEYEKSGKIQSFRALMELPKRTQFLLENDRIWPKEASNNLSQSR